MLVEEVDEKLASLAQVYAEKADPLPPGKSGITTRADLEAIRLRIIHGVSKKEVDDAGEGVLPYPLLEEKS